MELNGREKLIYEMIVEDINNSTKPYSVLTNNEISKKLDVSVFSVRDKITKLHNKRVLQRVNEFWDEDGNYHNRVLYKGR